MSVIIATSGLQQNIVVALDPKGGKVLWRFRLQSTVSNVVAKILVSKVFQLTFICGNDGSVLALNANNGGSHLKR